MKTKFIRISAFLMAALMLVGSMAACADTNGPEETKAESSATTNPGDSSTPGESETLSAEQELQSALDALGEIDYGNRELGVIYAFENEIVGKNETVDAEGGTAQVINDAIYARNTLLEDRCNLKFTPVEVDDVPAKVRVEATAPTGDFVFINSRLDSATSSTTNGFLSNLVDMDINLEGPWWDSGTAGFVLNEGVYFMSGSLNFQDDNVTYVLIFNKEMRETYANTVPNPYDTVRNWEWTLDHFNTIIQGVSAENGSGVWDEQDTYGFLTTWEYGNTMFLGCDLRYILNDDSVDEPTLFLSDQSKMEKALDVLDLAQAIYHENHATFMSPPGQEGLGVTAFKENRGMFFGEVVAHIATLNAEMKGDYGIVPVPKYDVEQEYYRTWTHESGSAFSITSSAPAADKEVLGQIMTAFAILSHQYVKPAYYDTVLTSRNMRDADSAEMMDLIFANRVYDMAFYFRGPGQFGFYDLFKTAVNDDSDSFTSSYEGQTGRKFSKTMENLLKKLK